MKRCIDCKHHYLTIYNREMDRCAASFVSPVDGKLDHDGRRCLDIRKDTNACGPDGKWFEAEEPTKLAERKQKNEAMLESLRYQTQRRERYAKNKVVSQKQEW